MKFFILCLILLTNYCYCEYLVGGWSVSQDDSLKKEWLNKALGHIYGTQINDEIRSEAANIICETQVVNGINIRCSFLSRGQNWRCSYYKSLIESLETQLEGCKQTGVEQVAEDKAAANEHEHEQEQQPPSIIKENDDEQEQQPSIVKENDDEDEEQQQQPGSVVETEKDNQAVQEVPVSNNDEEEDEAAVDTLNRKMSEQISDNEDEQNNK